MYAVLPDRNVIQLARPDDVLTLGIQLQSKDDALQLVRFYTEPGSWVRAKFERMGYWELPEDDSCRTLTGWNGSRKPVVVREATADGTHYVVTRHMIPNAKRASFWPGGTVAVDEIVRVTEHVRLDGAYSIKKTEALAVPGVVLRDRCHLL